MDYKKFLGKLNFGPKENASGIFVKKYPQVEGYVIEVDLEKQKIDYGKLIKADSKTTQNFSQPENFVVLECVNRLLEKGYKPKNIILEKTWTVGIREKGRLDILVTKNDGAAYLMIECKTYGEEFDKEFKKMKNIGGQLFSYFQQDLKTELLMLYSSDFKSNKIISQTKIVKIEEKFRNAGSVEGAHELWNREFYERGFWENQPYNFQPKKFTKADLKELTEDEGRKLFHGFATILRKHSVSDKPNAFNVIFNLFLAKLYDEQKRDEDELEFQWKESDNPVDFQIRLYNLHKEGLFDFLKKEIEGIKEEDFDAKQTAEERYRAKKKFLKFNKLFDIKSVIDDDDFEQNHRVLLEVVLLLQNYQIRYPRKQKYLSEFFELLLTTGLKQEVGQYFTPPHIAKFIVKSLPLSTMIEQAVNQPTPSLPATIDYAAGSGHFITEILEEYQDIIESLDTASFYPKAQKEVKSWKADPYNWASTYVYGIEKDYRLVKVAKVGCYFYGDGLAQVIHGDGLDSFRKSKSYVGLLKDNAQKPQFSVLVSNPPYSVDDVKDDLEYIGVQNDFKLFSNLTAKSSEIEALFIERTAQLLKENGIAGVILPSSILSNSRIYSKAREIILQKFDIVGITQLGGNTFMATNTNTVVLFLRKRNEDKVKRIEDAAYNMAENYKKTGKDLTIEGIKKNIEKPVQKYFDYTGETEIDFDKFYYFILNYHQKAVIVKTGEKEDEKKFLGYKIVKRRGDEGYHAISGDSIDKCTKLYDDNENETKANFYISKAFNGEFPKIHESLNDNVFYVDLIDMLAFDREKFDKNISLVVKKKVKIESNYEQILFTNAIQGITGSTQKIEKYNIKPIGKFPVITQEKERLIAGYSDSNDPITDTPIILFGDHSCTLKYIDFDFLRGADGTVLLKPHNEFNPKYFYNVLQYLLLDLIENKNKYERHYKYLQKLYIPLPPKEIQEKIVAEIEVLEKKEIEINNKINNGKEQIEQLCLQTYSKYNKEKLNLLVKINPSKSEIVNLDINTQVSFVDMASVSNDGYIISKADKLYSEIKKGSYTYFCENDIIIAKITPCMENGKCALAANLTNGLAFGSSEFHVFRANKDKIDTKYLFVLLNRKSVRVEAEKNMTGASGHRRVPIAFYENLQIPVPPLSEQQKIVSKIEKIETQIVEAQRMLNEISVQKKDVLKKYEIY